MKRLFGLCTGLALMLSTVGCCYYPGQFDPSTGLTSGGYWGAGCLAPLNPFCWIGALGCGHGCYGGHGYGAYPVGYGAPVLSGPTYVQPGFAPSYGGSGCSDCTASPTYAPSGTVVPPSITPTPAVPTPVPATATAPHQTAGQPMWIPARY